MTTLLRRRIQKIESLVGAPPTPDRNVALLFEPRRSDPAEKWAEFHAKLGAAQRTAEKVFVVGFDRKQREEGPGNAIYEPFDIDTIGQIFAMKRGANLREATPGGDSLADMTSKVIMPVGAAVTGDRYDMQD